MCGQRSEELAVCPSYVLIGWTWLTPRFENTDSEVDLGQYRTSTRSELEFLSEFLTAESAQQARG